MFWNVLPNDANKKKKEKKMLKETKETKNEKKKKNHVPVTAFSYGHSPSPPICSPLIKGSVTQIKK